jgi:hypothetical protein
MVILLFGCGPHCRLLSQYINRQLSKNLIAFETDYSINIMFFTLFTPFTSLASLAATFNAAMLPALPVKVTTPFFVVTETLRVLLFL